jgi:diguanylate cyclase (GGDEF)-like protein
MSSREHETAGGIGVRGPPVQAGRAGPAPGISMASRLALLFVLLVVLLLSVAIAYMSYSWRAAKEDRANDLRNLVSLGSASAQLFLQHYTERAGMLVQDLAESGRLDDRGALRALLHRHHHYDPNIAAIYLFDAAGNILASSNNAPVPGLPPHRADPVFARDFEQALAAKVAFAGRIRFGSHVDDWILPVRASGTDVRSGRSFVVSIAIPMRRQQSVWQGVALPQRWAIGLLRDDGYLQARHPAPPDAQKAFMEPHTGALLERLQRENFPAAGTVEGPGTFFSADKVLVAFRRLDGFPMTAYVRMPASEIWTAWRSHMAFPALLFAVSLVAMVTAGAWAVRQQREREAERDAAEQSLRASAVKLERQTLLLEQSQRTAQIGAWELNLDSGELYWTPQTYGIHEVSPTDFTPTWEAALAFFASDSAPFIRDAMQRALSTGEPWDLEVQLITAKGRRIWVRSTGAAEVAGGKAVRAWGSFQDITQRRRSEEQIVRLAHYDEITGLANRNLFSTHLSHAVMRAQRNELRLAVLFIDLDRFKNINDALGHDVGDEVLQVVARRLGEALRASDILARLGGDEFVVIAEDVSQPDTIAVLANKLLAAVDQPMPVRGQEFVLTASIGISLYPGDGTDAHTLLKNADTAMYRAKELGRNMVQFYSPQMGSANLHRLTLETQLKRAAAETNQFLLHYQPRVALNDGRIVGVECLVRWMHPERGLVPPAQFIPLAEELGLIQSIGAWVLRDAARQAAQWQRAGLPAVRVAINISAQQLYASTFLEELREVLSERGLDPGTVELEITESVMMQRTQQVSELLHSIRTLGLQLSVDDFGTGYSSLAYLKRLPIHSLKIDRSFVSDVPNDPDASTIVRAVIALAHSLRMQVVAEGVENRAQLEFLRAEGCDEVQGYLVSRPVTADAITELLANGAVYPGIADATAAV